MNIRNEKRCNAGAYTALGGNMKNKAIISKERSRHHKILVRLNFNIKNCLIGGVE